LWRYTGVTSWYAQWGCKVSPTDNRDTLLKEDSINKFKQAAEVLNDMRALNVTSAYAKSTFETAAHVLTNVMGLVAKDGEPLAPAQDVARLLDLRGLEFDVNRWFCSRNTGRRVPVHDQFKPRAGMDTTLADRIIDMYRNLGEKYEAVADAARAAKQMRGTVAEASQTLMSRIAVAHKPAQRKSTCATQRIHFDHLIKHTASW
jgi:hypothetical protein